MTSSIPPEDLVGLLADGDRLRVFAALVLGHETLAGLRRATDLTTRQVGIALSKLVDSGVVAQDKHGYRVLENELKLSAREALQREEPEHDVRVLLDHSTGDEDLEAARVLRAFVKDGRVQSIPAAHAKRTIILDLLAQDFEPGRRYSEKQVNLILGKRYADTAALRRHLVDDGFLEREGGGGHYWRTGGTFEIDGLSSA